MLLVISGVFYTIPHIFDQKRSFSRVFVWEREVGIILWNELLFGVFGSL